MNSVTTRVLFLLVILPAVGCEGTPKETVTGNTAGNSGLEARPFNGEAYRTQDGRSAITLISPVELEYRLKDGTILLCKYSKQDDGLRVVATALGTQQVLYFRRVSNGLLSNDGVLYLSPAGLAEVQRQEEQARLARQAAEVAAQRERAEREEKRRIPLCQ